MRPEWFPDWTGEDCVIVASGPSASEQPIELARNRCRVITINNSYRLAPWADVLYGSDAEWWKASQPVFDGLKISRCTVDNVHRVELKKTAKGEWHHDLVLFEPGIIGAGGHGGFQALDLAYQFGSRRIALVGFDMRIDLGTHWHGDHAKPLRNPHQATAAIWIECTDRQASRLVDAGASVTNCSPVSALSAYPKMGLEQWLLAQTWHANRIGKVTNGKKN